MSAGAKTQHNIKHVNTSNPGVIPITPSGDLLSMFLNVKTKQ